MIKFVFQSCHFFAFSSLSTRLLWRFLIEKPLFFLEKGKIILCLILALQEYCKYKKCQKIRILLKSGQSAGPFRSVLLIILGIKNETLACKIISRQKLSWE